MKKIILLLCLFLIANVNAQDFDKKWIRVIQYENEGKIKSANAEVEKIYKKATSKKDETQIIKCFFYTSKYIQILDENAQSIIIKNLRIEIEKATIPTKSILNLVYAKCLNSYYNNNKYKINKRTPTDSISDNFLIWTSNDFDNTIQNTFSKTLDNATTLKKTPLLNYEQILDFQSTEDEKKQTLYEYLLNENIVYYTSKINTWEINSDDFINYKVDLFSNSSSFINLNLDFISNKYLKGTVSLYQKLETFNPSKENEFERLKFVSKFIIKSNEDFLTTLNSLQKSVKNESLLKKIQLEKASLYSNLASKETHPNYNTIAISIVDSILSKNDHSNSYKLAELLKNQITFKKLNIQLQKYSYNNENSRALIDFKNTNNVTVSYYKIDQKKYAEINKTSSKKDSIIQQYISNHKVLKSSEHKLPNKNDYFNYTTEILLPQLETGSYLVYFETDDVETKKAFAYETITISNFTLLTNSKKNVATYQILDRKNGNPIENAKIKSDLFELITDKNGNAKYTFESKLNYQQLNLEITKASDTLQINNSYSYSYSYPNDDEDNEFKARVQFFLDRAIYRPGQTVYYKGIAIQKKNNQSSTVANETFNIIVEDANYNEIQNFNVTTNEFGSFSGEFIIPKNGLTGSFMISADEPDDLVKLINYDSIKKKHAFWDKLDDFENSKIRFQVEEYKRPKFEVTFEPIKETYLINQNIIVKGNANAFSGSNVTDAKVSYTVSRTTNFNKPYREYSYEKPEIITTGETKTDASGKFLIDFIAKPSNGSRKENLPIFTYQIEATVTDINGETHSKETVVLVGYQSIMLKTSLPAVIETKNKNNITLNSTNLNGEFTPIKGELKFYFVNDNNDKFKPRLWNKPEIAGISDEEFNILFPYEINKYGDDKPKTEILIKTIKVDTEQEKTIALTFLTKEKSGQYKVVFSALDKFNNEIESVTNFELKQSKDLYDKSKIFTITQLNDNPKKDGYIAIKLNSVLTDFYINVFAVYNDNRMFESNIKIKNHTATLKIPIKNDYKNSVGIGFQGIFENYEVEEQIKITLKTEVPKLEFEVSSFRDKIQPGAIENWSFKIKNDNVYSQSEVVASMYDSSLDQFKTDHWGNLLFNDYQGNYIRFNQTLGFTNVNIQIANLNPPYKRIELKNENTELIWFGFDFNNTNSYLLNQKYKNQITKKAKKPSNAKVISGIVTSASDNMEIPGANITVKGTLRSTETDFDGYYEIDAAEGETLVFSMIGNISKTITVGIEKNINVQLQEDEIMLEGVVVEGYGVTRTKVKSNVASTTVLADSSVYKNEEIVINGRANSNFIETLQGQIAGVSISTGSGQPGASNTITIRGTGHLNKIANSLYVIDGIPYPINSETMQRFSEDDIQSINVLTGSEATTLYGSRGANGVIVIITKKGIQELSQVKSRTNLNETAFFYPNLYTNNKGEISFNFTSPESLTSWKLRLLAHQKNTVSGYLEKNVITQKELMVLPNLPRFFREKDSITITAKISNITKDAKTGIANLQLFDAVTMQPVDSKTLNNDAIKNFSILPFGNTTVSWKIYIPEGLQGIQYKIVAKAGDFSDGEESILPVLTNNILVTESIPIWVKGNTSKEYTFSNLKNNTSTTLRSHQLTLEYTSNPAWFAIQSLPYLMEYEHECSEQTFNRFYANALATEIINSNPKIAKVFESWREKGKLNPKVEQNEALKSIILAETPWFNDAQSEAEKKNKMAVLFDLEKMKNSQELIFEKLKQKQNPSGGFVWFDGGRENNYITTYILSGFGHLQKLEIEDAFATKIAEVTKIGIPFIDRNFQENQSNKMGWYNNSTDLYYLYTRSFYLKEYPISETLNKTIQLNIKNYKENWLTYSLYQKGLVALVLNRFGEKETAKKILVNLKETTSNNEDYGMYWIANKPGWYWYQSPIETQALLIEAFTEIDNDTKSVDEMKVWLIKNKQTKSWPTTKATSEAIYALLMQGSDWLSVKDNTVLKIGDDKIVTKKLSENEKEAETGLLKLNWNEKEITSAMATVSIKNKSTVPGLGGFYWQYFEDLDKIKTNSENDLSVSKELYLKTNSTNGTTLNKITANNPIKVGDLVIVRLIITAKEDFDFIHLKDMRASCFEPIDVISEYKYKDGLGYYMSTKDAATHFFFDAINKGTYVLEYEVRVNNIGDFSNGITTIQSMYAPEFASHTKGIRVMTVKSN